MKRPLLILVAALFLFSCVVVQAEEFKEKDMESVPLPGVSGGIGFDDLVYAKGLRKLLVPGGYTGKLFLVDPDSREISFIEGFSAGEYHGGHGNSVTSADEGGGFIFTADRTKRSAYVIDPRSRGIVSFVALKGEPDYVRFISSTYARNDTG